MNALALQTELPCSLLHPMPFSVPVQTRTCTDGGVHMCTRRQARACADRRSHRHPCTFAGVRADVHTDTLAPSVVAPPDQSSEQDSMFCSEALCQWFPSFTSQHSGFCCFCLSFLAPSQCYGRGGPEVVFLVLLLFSLF